MIRSQAFRSLRYRNFRIYYIGQLVSLNGTWMQSVAQSWLVYRLTGSATLLGLTGALTLLPNLLFGMYGGLLADRFSRQRLLIIVHALAMLQALVLGVLTMSGQVEAWHILLLAFILGLVQAVETPVRQSLIVQLVERQDLPNAIALNSSMFHLARFIGPAIAGVLVALIGEGPVFLINAFTFVAIIGSLFYLQLPSLPTSAESRRGLSGIWSGLHYARQHRLTRTVLAMVALVSLLGGAAVVLMPVFVVQVFGHGAESLGIFMGMLGLGSLTGALSLAQKRDFALLERRVAVAAVSVGLGLLVFALNTSFVAALAILFVIGLASTSVFASSNALIQLAVPDHLRGRTMALFTMCLHGMASLGHMLLGFVGDGLGAPLTVGLSGCLLFCLALLLAVSLFRLNGIEDQAGT